MNKYDDLSDREKAVLISTVVEYIKKGKPVSSSTLSNDYTINVSSATIRNVLAQLEDDGYVYQPHVSAGRIPTDKGYRFYVDNSIFYHDLSFEEKRKIRNFSQKRILKLDKLLNQISKMLSQISSKIGVSVLPHMQYDKIKCIKIVPVTKSKMFAVIITKSGFVREELFQLENSIHLSRDFIQKVNNYLERKICNVKINEAKNILKKDKMITNYKFLYEVIFDKLMRTTVKDSNIYIKGLTNYLKYDKSSELIEVFEQGIIDNIIKNEKNFNSQKLMIKIGHENKVKYLNDYSLISKSVDIDENLDIKIALLGEKRVDYGKMISILEYTANILKEKFNREEMYD
ncbi:MAG: heat-inducible transcription repressor HrcA [Candidatus Mcinerneyibacterium aminivorans]|uniref:Heat-inducible transcription repressor HrcA n=1 Tax=Candidatus Mcinerneyibacterium aminivorans TaxID=2703815 RepID=A0A5D0MFM6_9BACT|nr:MAG: heat-inducible transcription repressor HrcA [Candidatus Mcinerneyibacterium aminivorans]